MTVSVISFNNSDYTFDPQTLPFCDYMAILYWEYVDPEIVLDAKNFFSDHFGEGFLFLLKLFSITVFDILYSSTRPFPLKSPK